MSDGEPRRLACGATRVGGAYTRRQVAWTGAGFFLKNHMIPTMACHVLRFVGVDMTLAVKHC